MNKPLLKNITYYVGAFAMFVAGILYMFMSDVTFYNTSDKLIISILLSFGSAISFFFSANFNEKPKIAYVLKGIGIALAIGLVVYLHVFQHSEFYLSVLEKFRKQGRAGKKKLASSQATMIITIVLGYLSVVGQAANTALTAVWKEN